jgi:predicted nucleotidyltransferase
MDVSRYLEGWRLRARHDEEARLAAERRAREAVPEAVRVLRRLGATRIWLIGSLPRGTFQPSSDLDFLASGMTEESAWRAASEAARVTGLWVDVVRGEALTPEWRAYHEKYGERLHG